MSNDILAIQSEIVKTLKTIYDPEIPVNIYDLGLIYDIDVNDDKSVKITMTMTSPNCPMAEELLAEVNQQVRVLPNVSSLEVKLTFDPPWDKDRLSEEAKLELGFL